MWALLPGALALLLLYAWVRVVRFKRMLENIPTSKVKGVLIGMNEVKGVAECADPVVTHLSERPAVWYEYSIDERWERTETATDDRGETHTNTESGWRTVDSGREYAQFDLRDDTGAILVDPNGARIEAERVFSESVGRQDPLYYGKGPANATADSTGRRRFSERAILVGHDLYVLGTARLRDDVVAPMTSEMRATRTTSFRPAARRRSRAARAGSRSWC